MIPTPTRTDPKVGLALGLTLVFSLFRLAPDRGAAATAAAVASAESLSSAAQRVSAAPAPPQNLYRGNLLANPGFEEGFHPAGAQELVVGLGWLPWYDRSLTRPEMKDEPFERRRDDGSQSAFSARVFHGEFVQKMFTSSGAHDAGVYQVMPSSPGERFRFSVWVEAWSSDCDDACVSPLSACRFDSANTHGTYRVQVGIDPLGNVPADLGAAAPDTVKWSGPIVFEAYDRWFRLEVAAEAQGDTIAVYTRGNPVWPVKHNDSYWDDARLETLPGPDAAPHHAYVPSVQGRPGPASQAHGASPKVVSRAAPARDPVPPGADIQIEYPIRAFPDQENFWLPTCDDLEFEAVVLANHGVVDVGLSGWTLADLAGNAYEFGDVTLRPGDRVRLWTKSGPDTTDGRFTDLYWRRAEEVWDGPAAEIPFDVAVLTDDVGTEVARRGYP